MANLLTLSDVYAPTKAPTTLQTLQTAVAGSQLRDISERRRVVSGAAERQQLLQGPLEKGESKIETLGQSLEATAEALGRPDISREIAEKRREDIRGVWNLALTAAAQDNFEAANVILDANKDVLGKTHSNLKRGVKYGGSHLIVTKTGDQFLGRLTNEGLQIEQLPGKAAPKGTKGKTPRMEILIAKIKKADTKLIDMEAEGKTTEGWRDNKIATEYKALQITRAKFQKELDEARGIKPKTTMPKE